MRAGLGAVKLRRRALPAALAKLVTVARDVTGRYWVSCAVEDTIEAIGPVRSLSVGTDLGIARLAALSTGETLENPRTLGKLPRYALSACHSASPARAGARTAARAPGPASRTAAARTCTR